MTLLSLIGIKILKYIKSKVIQQTDVGFFTLQFNL